MLTSTLYIALELLELLSSHMGYPILRFPSLLYLVTQSCLVKISREKRAQFPCLQYFLFDFQLLVRTPSSFTKVPCIALLYDMQIM